MKNFTKLILFLVMPFTLVAQWQPINLHSDIQVDLEVLSKDSIVFVPVQGGKIWRSFDGGANEYYYQTNYTDSWFEAVDFPSQDIGYACGGTAFGKYRNILLKTNDDGVNWNTLSENEFPGYSLNKVKFRNNQVGLISGENGLLLRTMDGGNSFETISLPNSETITSIEAVGNSTFIVGAQEYLSKNNYRYTIYTTSDDGDTWTLTYEKQLSPVNEVNNERINDILFVNNQVGYAVGGNGLFLTTVNGGQDWSKALLSPYTNLTTIAYTPNGNLYTNLAGGVYISADQGQNWQAQQMNPPAIVSKISFVNNTIGYMIADGDIYKTTNAGQSTLTQASKQQIDFTIYPNPATTKIHVETSAVIKRIELYDVQGKLIKKYSANETTIDVSALISGIYFLHLQNLQGETLTKKLVVE